MKALLGDFLQDFTERTSGIPPSVHITLHNLQRVADTLALPARFAPSGETLVKVDEIDSLLASEQPHGAANATAVELVQLALRIRRERRWSKTARLKGPTALCQKIVAADDQYNSMLRAACKPFALLFAKKSNASA